MTTFILYGATGDLAKRMVLPAFHGLAKKGLLGGDWRLIGNGRGDISDDAFRKEIHEVTADDDFESRLYFAGHGFSAEDPGELPDVLRKVGDDDVVHFLAVPPNSFKHFTEAIKAHGLEKNAKVIYEKPFGTSPQDFEELDTYVHTVFDEVDVFRIDHFIGKEAAQNIHALRFENPMFEAIWNREYVNAVHIDIPETLDIDDRAEFYDSTGALLDMIVTHLFHLAAEVAMEAPATRRAADLAKAREAVIAAFRPLDRDEVVLGQYDGYRQVEGVDQNSQTDTYVAARLWVDTDRWHGVPFLLRTGKMLKDKGERVTLVMKHGNLSFDLSGSGAIEHTFTVKKPGPDNSTTTATTHLELETLGDALEPYERLIHDAMTGDKGRYTRPDGLRFAWRNIESLLKNKPAVLPYSPGSWGPDQGTTLFNSTLFNQTAP